jgi:CRP/FNR family transcriptional regulator, anaerobic regulatory protein
MSDLLISRYPALATLPEPLVSRLLRETQSVTIASGTVLFDEQQPCEHFPFIVEGCVRVIKLSPTGRTLPLYDVLPGESCIISTGCIMGHCAYNARGVTKGDTTLVLIARPLFETLLEDPGFRTFVFAIFTERITALMQLVEEVAFRKLDQRLANALLGKGRSVHLSHQQLADELGSVREMVSRLLKNFAEHGWVRLGREEIEILDAGQLRHFASGQ